SSPFLHHCQPDSPFQPRALHHSFGSTPPPPRPPLLPYATLCRSAWPLSFFRNHLYTSRSASACLGTHQSCPLSRPVRSPLSDTLDRKYTCKPASSLKTSDLHHTLRSTASPRQTPLSAAALSGSSD